MQLFSLHGTDKHTFSVGGRFLAKGGNGGVEPLDPFRTTIMVLQFLESVNEANRCELLLVLQLAIALDTKDTALVRTVISSLNCYNME
jgi:hypothetical protein